MKTAYRVENLMQLGPYTDSFINAPEFRNSKTYMSSDDKRHPTPDEDAILKYHWRCLEDYSKWFCCFDSIKQLTEWFGKECRTALEFDGFSVVTYEVDKEDFIQGETQCLFRRGAKKPTGRMGLFMVDRYDLPMSYRMLAA